MIDGLTADPKMPAVLITAIPAGRAAGDSTLAGNVHRMLMAQNPPIETSANPPNRKSGTAEKTTSSQPAAAANIGIVTCHNRSWLRSDRELQSGIATTVSTAGIAVHTPMIRKS